MPKKQVYQISDKSVKFWPLEAAPKFLGHTHTLTQTFSDYRSTEVENKRNPLVIFGMENDRFS